MVFASSKNSENCARASEWFVCRDTQRISWAIRAGQMGLRMCCESRFYPMCWCGKRARCSISLQRERLGHPGGEAFQACADSTRTQPQNQSRMKHLKGKWVRLCERPFGAYLSSKVMLVSAENFL